MNTFGREVKPWVHIVDLRHVIVPQAEIRASEQNLLDFSCSVRESNANDLSCQEHRKTQTTTTVAGTD